MGITKQGGISDGKMWLEPGADVKPLLPVTAPVVAEALCNTPDFTEDDTPEKK